ncbi:ABC transporter substrate-binding protein [Bradyrhizobium sp.]|uniref:ABC transporter substrate-binding protein n=1 Tax=Bradyrhizobium sp. TaxID=376 RepID=UPI0025C65D46|nr:ABC transporter substrate-binding protein [Bradyrhizobium sp.]
MLVIGILLAGAANAAAAGNADIVRDLASRVGPVVGSALACRDIARPRIQTIVDKFAAVIREASSSEVERADLNQHLDRSVANGRNAVTSGQIDCKLADRQLADLERSIAAPSLSATIGPSSAVAATSTAPVTANPPQRGITDREIRFGIAAPFSGAAKELGRQMKLGIDTAFNRVNDSGGVEGRMLRLVAADDGYEPTRTAEAMKQLYEKDQVFAIVGNVGTPTAVVAIPYALERRMLFFGAFTGANVLRRDPPDRYVFNYRASYVQETDAVVRYLVKIRKLQPKQIAVFAQQDSYGDAGFAGVAKAFRALGANDGAILRLNYTRNTVDVEDAVNQLKAQKTPIKAVVMVSTYRAAARFIEKTRDLYPQMIYTNVSFVGSTALAEELKLLGARYANGVIVTQVVPAVSGYSSIVLEYKNALAKYFPGEAPDYVSLEGFIAANVLIQAIKRAGPQFDTEKLIDILESTRNLDLGLGTSLSFGRAEHQASHKVWGTALDETGKFQPIELE